MVDMNQYWIIGIGIGVGTLLTRASFILIMERITLPDTLLRMLRFIPASVLPALIVPAVFLHKNGITTFSGWERVIAALVAVLVAWKTRNVFLTIATGMIALWGLQTLM